MGLLTRGREESPLRKCTGSLASDQGEGTTAMIRQMYDIKNEETML